MSLEILQPYIERLMSADKNAVLSSLANYVFKILEEEESFTNLDVLRSFIKERFNPADVEDFLTSFWNKGFYYYPESLRNKFFNTLL